MSEIQAILFKKNKWSLKDAKRWMKGHNFKYLKIDETKNLYRFRIKSPLKFKKFRIKEVKNSDLMLVIAFK